MCRLLYLAGDSLPDCARTLNEFATACKNSREFQGHGYGISWKTKADSHSHHRICPIWENSLPSLVGAQQVVAHARSAFRDEGIVVENNMPFFADGITFAFNGELQGVRIREQGRIGAEKIFNVIRSCYQGDWGAALRDAMKLITSRTRYVRAMNVLLADETRAYLYSDFSEAPEYFTLHVHKGRELAVCSEVLPSLSGWEQLPRRTVEVFTR